MGVAFPFIGPAYQSRSPNYSSQRLVNMYLAPGKGKAPARLAGTPGLKETGHSTPFPIRGMMKLTETRAVIVNDARVDLIDENLNGVGSFGTVADDGLPVSIAFDGTNILICSSGVLYGSTISSVEIQTLVRADVSSVDFIGGYFILTEADSGRFFRSGQYTTAIDALDFATAEGAPDELVKV